MAAIDPRFEFRAWARTFGLVETRMRRASPCRDIRESDEIYLVSGSGDQASVKLRNGEIDIKALIAKEGGLEQWRPTVKCRFPLGADLLVSEVFPALGVAAVRLHRERYSDDQLLAEVVRPHGDLTAVQVFKRRFSFIVNHCSSEHDEVWINGAGLQSVAVESTDTQAVRETMRQLGLDAYDNVNYPRAIKRVIGMAPLTEPD